MGHEKEQPGINDSSRTVFTSDTVPTASSSGRNSGEGLGSSQTGFPRVVARMPQMGMTSGWGKSSQHLPAMLITWIVGKSYRWVSMVILLLLAGSLLLGYIATTVSSGLAPMPEPVAEVTFPDDSFHPDSFPNEMAVSHSQNDPNGPLTGTFAAPVISREQEENVLSMTPSDMTNDMVEPAFHAVGYQEPLISNSNPSNPFPAVSDEMDMPVIAAEEMTGIPTSPAVANAPITNAPMANSPMMAPAGNPNGTPSPAESTLPTWNDLAREQAQRNPSPTAWPNQGPAVQPQTNGDTVYRSYPSNPGEQPGYATPVYTQPQGNPTPTNVAMNMQPQTQTQVQAPLPPQTLPQTSPQTQMAPMAPAYTAPAYNVPNQNTPNQGQTWAAPANQYPTMAPNQAPNQAPAVPATTTAPVASGYETGSQAWNGYASPARDVREVNYETGTTSTNITPAYTEKNNFRGYQIDSSLESSRINHGPTNYSSSDQGYNQTRNRW